MSFFSAENISAGYGRQSIISNVSFSVEKGCLTGIIGANGSGKTTLLKALCGILPHTGTCTLDDKTLEDLSPKALARLISYIPQRSGITIDISVIDVVLMGLNPRLGLLEHPSRKMRYEATEILQRVGLAGKSEMNYLHLSEGQKQLCILARTLISGCRLLLLDEPESALDFSFRHNVLSLLRDFISSENSSVIVTLHDPGLALNYCDKLVLLSDGGVSAVIDPKNDPLERTESLFSRMYGSVSLQRCMNNSGQEQIVMLKENNGRV